MRIRKAVTAYLVLTSLVSPGMAGAPAQVAYLSDFAASNPRSREIGDAFSGELKARGWVEGKNITIIRRYSDGSALRAGALAAELIADRPEVIFAIAYPAAKAAAERTKTIPIVFTGVPDPVRLGLVKSLAAPGGNVTGAAWAGSIGRGMQLLQRTSPQIRRIGYLGYGRGDYWQLTVQHATEAGKRLGVAVSLVPVGSDADFAAAFAQLKRAGADAWVVSSIPLFRKHAKEIADFAIAHGLPTFAFSSPMAREGFLFAESPDDLESVRRAASILDKILRGAKPSDIPVEEPTRFHLTANLKTARALGLQLSPVILAGADEIIP